MSDTLEIYGKTYTGVEGIKAKDDNGNTVTFFNPTYTKAAATITPGTTAQTIAAGTYLTGAQTISGDANLIAANIKKNTTIFGVTGSYEGSGGGGIGTLLKTQYIGEATNVSTTGQSIGVDVVVNNANAYDALLLITSSDTVASGLMATCEFMWLTASSTAETKNGITLAGARQYIRVSNTGVYTIRQSSTAYGIYSNSRTLSDGTVTMPMYMKSNSTYTGTMGGRTYTARVYGIKIMDLI